MTAAHGQSAACGLANLAVLCCALIGCAESASVAPEAKPKDRVEIPLVDRAAFDAVLAGLEGKVVLVDCWATWCGPCVAQLPHSIQLAHEQQGAGLAVVTLNFDDPESADQVRQTLAAAGADAGVTSLQSKFGSSSESMVTFEISSGALPHYKLFDRRGQLRQVFELDPSAKQQFSPADVDQAVADLLAE